MRTQSDPGGPLEPYLGRRTWTGPTWNLKDDICIMYSLDVSDCLPGSL